MVTEQDLSYLRRCVELAEDALAAGDAPFGSVLVTADGNIVAEDRNRAFSVDPTRHPEFELARWAATNLDDAERAGATLFTSGEHCPMCAAAHGWVGLGRIVYATSSEQLTTWLGEFDRLTGRVRALPIQTIVPDLTVEGPVDEFAASIRELHRRAAES